MDDGRDEEEPPERRPFATVLLVVLATQTFYVYREPGEIDPQLWPWGGLLAGALAWVFLRPDHPSLAGLTTRGLGRGLAWVAALLAIGHADLVVGAVGGWVEIEIGVPWITAEDRWSYAGRVGFFLAVSVLGDELAFRGLLQEEAIARWGRAVAVGVISVAFVLYRVPYGIATGLVDDWEWAWPYVAREAIAGLTLSLLYLRTRNLLATGLYAFALFGGPALLLGDIEESLQPVLFYGGTGDLFRVLRWVAVVSPLVVLGITALRSRS